MGVESIFQPQNYTVSLSFRPANGGRGTDLAPTGTASAPVALPAQASRPQGILLSNDSMVTWFIVFGDGEVAAMPGDLTVLAGTQVTFTLPNDHTYTHFSTITRGEVAFGTICFGLGE